MFTLITASGDTVACIASAVKPGEVILVVEDVTGRVSTARLTQQDSIKFATEILNQSAII